MDVDDDAVRTSTHVQADLGWTEPALDNRLLPLLKWTGGKRDLVRSLLPFLPQRFRRYYEPFMGGGAMFFALRPQTAILADKNEELINCYVQVRDNPDAVIAQLDGMPNSEENYYQIRSAIPDDPIGRAARLVYLTTLSFNGIYRVNLSGKFNVPYGHKTNINPCDAGRIQAASKALKSADLLCADFEQSVASAQAGDFVYLDPPYTVAHGNNGFVKYNAAIFSWSDQTRLASVANELKERGCHVVISNADHVSVKQLYPDFKCAIIHRASRMSARAEYRRKVTESVLYSGE